MERILRFLSLFVAISLGVVSGVSASDTGWQNHQDMVHTRVIAGSVKTQENGKLLLAWEAKLAPGWKTYWRSPGEAGLPVRVFADGKELEIEYPYPERFELFGMSTYGYSSYVMLPFMVDATVGVDGISIDADFMVCKEICVPFRANYKVPKDQLNEAMSIHDSGLKRWLGKVPEKTGGDSAGLEILSVKVMGPIGHQKLIVDATADHKLSKADMLAEVNDMFHFGKPKMRLLADGKSIRFVMHAMGGKHPEDLKRLKARLTFTDGKGASIERTFDLSKPTP